MDKISIVEELVSNGVYCTAVIMRNNALAFEFNGFAKSGIGLLFEENGELYVETRYKRIDKVTCTYDVVKIAYDWDKSYSYSVNYPDSNFIYPGNSWYKLYKKYELVE